jgi:hypothetical protein
VVKGYINRLWFERLVKSEHASRQDGMNMLMGGIMQDVRKELNANLAKSVL